MAKPILARTTEATSLEDPIASPFIKPPKDVAAVQPIALLPEEDVAEAEPQVSGVYYPTQYALEEFVRHRDQVWDIRKANFAGYENLLLTLSAATLAFSLTYIKDIVGSHSPAHPELIKGSWALLALTIFLLLMSYLWGARACERDIELYQAFYYHNDSTQSNRYARWVEWTHWAAGLCFVLGLSFTIIFASINYTATSKTSLEKPKNQESKNKMSTKIQQPVPVQPGDGMKGGYGTKPTALPPAPKAPAPQAPAPKK